MMLGSFSFTLINTFSYKLPETSVHYNNLLVVVIVYTTLVFNYCGIPFRSILNAIHVPHFSYTFKMYSKNNDYVTW